MWSGAWSRRIEFQVPCFAVVLALVALAGRSASGQSPAERPPEQGQEASSAPVAEPVEKVLRSETQTDLSLDRLRFHVPDPEVDRAQALAQLEKAQSEANRVEVTYHTRVFDRVDTIRRPEQVHLTLEEVLHRSLRHNYAVEIERFNPAIDGARIVEAESAFDAVWFTNLVRNKQDRPTGSQLVSSDLDFFDISGGVRKLLPTGMMVGANYGLQRTKSNLSFQQVNPEYFSTIVMEFRQPLLRGFGLDFNRSLILVARNDRRISEWAFQRRVRDTLRQVEEAYWRLVEARRNIVMTARLLADFEQIYDFLSARQTFDITPVQLSATKANLEQSRAEFVRIRDAVFDTEDRLIALMNDPEINLVNHPEIIPDDLPVVTPVQVDRLAEVKTALEHRHELREQELVLSNARINVIRAKNQELPKFDLTFRYTIDGLAGNADKSFDEVSRHNFVEYFVGIDFEIPIGNRGPRATHRRARLLHEQAETQVKSVLDQVILDVNLAVRQLATTFDQILPSFESAEARQREVESIVARAERKDLNTLNSELGARQSLRSARQAMLRAMVDYNIALIDLERAKGTLLRHYNVVVMPASSD